MLIADLLSQVFNERQARVERVCQKYGDEVLFVDFKDFLSEHLRFIPKKSLAMCLVPKVIYHAN